MFITGTLRMLISKKCSQSAVKTGFAVNANEYRIAYALYIYILVIHALFLK